MLNRLRLQMTLLYILATTTLIGLMVFGAYWLLDRYFHETTDLALSYRMAQEFRARELPLPDALVRAEEHWYSHAGAQPTATVRSSDDHDDEEEHHKERAPVYTSRSELAPIMVLELDSAGRPVSAAQTGLPIAPDVTAIAAAAATGSDLRTVRTADGTPIRLLTRRLPEQDRRLFLQVGRAIDDQERTLQQLLFGMLALGAAASLIVGAASWYLAGRSLQPAQQAWERQQNFIANASHELRTPLTLMRASAEVAQRSLPDASGDAGELLGDVLAECDHMSRLVDDLLLLSRLDSRRLPLELRSVPIGDLLDDLRRQVGRLAEERAITLDTVPAAGSVRADPMRLRQIILILLDNALRYTPPGGTITLKAAAHPHTMTLAVSDTGPGIAAEHLPRIFERFYRVDSSRTSTTGGSGLGLAIAKGMTEAQGGRIEIASRAGAGTTVTITLPTA
jgi:signal transduction histidine kinase